MKVCFGDENLLHNRRTDDNSLRNANKLTLIFLLDILSEKQIDGEVSREHGASHGASHGFASDRYVL
jgi:hypothetical protein